MDPPAAPGALAPRLAAGTDGLRLSWLEPTADDDHRLQTAVFDGDAWGPAVTVAEGDDFFANWADVPSVVESPHGVLTAHWLARLGEGTYAYGVRLARSGDGGATWRSLGWLHDDRSPTEHGFASLVAQDDAPPFAVWLDGRRMMDGGPMELRGAEVTGGDRAGTVVDGRVCECCTTAAVASDGGVVVAYRDRLEDEIRDNLTTRWDGEGWSEPAALGDEGWKIFGCPVNGPALAADDARVAAAWFTAEGGRPRVSVAFSDDGGRGFGPPQTVADSAAVGRVAVALDGDGSALVAWLARSAGEGEDGGEGDDAGGALVVRRIRRDGESGEARAVAEVTTARATGFPQLVRRGEHAYLAWVDTAANRVVFGRLAVAGLP